MSLGGWGRAEGVWGVLSRGGGSLLLVLGLGMCWVEHWESSV